MSIRNLTLELEPRQDFHEDWLTAADRRVLLGASLRILTNRFSAGKKILKSDVLRVATLADSERTA